MVRGSGEAALARRAARENSARSRETTIARRGGGALLVRPRKRSPPSPPTPTPHSPSCQKKKMPPPLPDSTGAAGGTHELLSRVRRGDPGVMTPPRRVDSRSAMPVAPAATERGREGGAGRASAEGGRGPRRTRAGGAAVGAVACLACIVGVCVSVCAGCGEGPTPARRALNERSKRLCRLRSFRQRFRSNVSRSPKPLTFASSLSSSLSARGSRLKKINHMFFVLFV